MYLQGRVHVRCRELADEGSWDWLVNIWRRNFLGNVREMMDLSHKMHTLPLHNLQKVYCIWWLGEIFQGSLMQGQRRRDGGCAALHCASLWTGHRTWPGSHRRCGAVCGILQPWPGGQCGTPRAVCCSQGSAIWSWVLFALFTCIRKL